MSQLNNITSWYESLQSRDRNLLILITIVLVATLFFLLVWEPIYKGHEEAIQKQTNLEKSLVWMKQAQQEVRALRASGVRTNKRNSNAPVSLSIEQSAATSGVKGALTKTESSGKDSARTTLENVSFNQLMVWINTLEQNFGIVASNVSVDGTSKQGLVNARITFSRGG